MAFYNRVGPLTRQPMQGSIVRRAWSDSLTKDAIRKFQNLNILLLYYCLHFKDIWFNFLNCEQYNIYGEKKYTATVFKIIQTVGLWEKVNHVGRFQKNCQTIFPFKTRVKLANFLVSLAGLNTFLQTLRLVQQNLLVYGLTGQCSYVPCWFLDWRKVMVREAFISSYSSHHISCCHFQIDINSTNISISLFMQE